VQLKIATRKSDLAMWQARHVAEKLETLDEVDRVELLPMSTRGDEVLDRSLQKIGGKGLFIKELEDALQQGRADIAVHSMKDVPGEMPAGFCIAAVLARANPCDALVTSDKGGLDSVPQGGTIGSSSLRRQAQLYALRPDLAVVPLRGNVNTRLARLQLGKFDAIVLASAGLDRLGFASRISEEFAPEKMLPAAAQGVLGIECLQHRDDLRALLGRLEHPPTTTTTIAERAVARVLQASCQSPVASYATLQDNEITLRALVASADGMTILRESAIADASDADSIGIEVAERLLERGAAKLLAQ
jgi:hydroxymethylbilane synthase